MMERVDTLIKKINEQFADNANINDMLLTCKMLQEELNFIQQQTGQALQPNIAITITPNYSATPQPIVSTLVVEEEVVEKIPEMQPISEMDVTASMRPPLHEMHVVNNPAVVEGEKIINVLEVDEATIAAELADMKREKEQIENIASLSKLRVTDLEETNEKVELNDALVAQAAPSLNDKLKQANLNLVDTLVEEPVKDLRKAIGINDRFLFINELFRGDEAMYERSIKTINGFSILPEAEYWIQRELKVKIGWSEQSDVVQQFNQLIRRRFS